MQSIPGSSEPDQPSVIGNPWFGSLQNVTSTSTVVTASSYPNYQMFLQGIDLVNPTFTNGYNALVDIQSTAMAGGGVFIFQGFVYTTSQACFSWRGNFPLPSDAIIKIQVPVGSWNIACYGVMFPEGPAGRWS